MKNAARIALFVCALVALLSGCRSPLRDGVTCRDLHRLPADIGAERSLFLHRAEPFDFAVFHSRTLRGPTSETITVGGPEQGTAHLSFCIPSAGRAGARLEVARAALRLTTHPTAFIENGARIEVLPTAPLPPPGGGRRPSARGRPYGAFPLAPGRDRTFHLDVTEGVEAAFTRGATRIDLALRAAPSSALRLASPDFFDPARRPSLDILLRQEAASVTDASAKPSASPRRAGSEDPRSDP